MKLHLPTMLRKALLACFAAVSSVTFATGSAWADDLLASNANWTLGSGFSYADGSISKSSSWGGIKASEYSTGSSYYTVKSDNTLTFTLGFTSATEASAPSASASNSVLTFAWTGGDDAVVMGADTYNVTAYRYGTTTDTTAASYASATGLGLTPFAADGTDMTRAWGVDYTLQGTVTLADGNYTLVMTLNDGTNTYTSDTINLGDSFQLNRFVMSSEGGADTLTQLEIDGLYVERIIYTTTLTGVVDASAATWLKDGVAVNYSDIPLTGGDAVMEVAGGEGGGTLAVSGTWDVYSLSVTSGTVALKLENGANLTAQTVSGFSGIQMDNGEQATIADGTVSVAGSILTSGSTAKLTLANADLNLSGNQDLYGTMRITGDTSLTGGRMTIKHGGTLLLADGANFTRTGGIAHWGQGSLATELNATASFVSDNDFHLGYDDSTNTGSIDLAQGSTLNMQVASLQVWNTTAINLADNATLNLNSWLGNDGNTTVTLGQNAEMNISGALSGGGTKTFNVGTDATVDIGTLEGGGTKTFSGTGAVEIGTMKHGGATVNIQDSVAVTTETFCSGNGNSTINITGTASLTVTGTTEVAQNSSNPNPNTNSFLLGHWTNTTVAVNVDGGTLVATGARVLLGLDGTGNISVTNGGVADLKGLTFRTRWTNSGSLVLGAAEGGDATLKIGESGIDGVTGESVTVTLGNGTIEATADWAMTGNGTVNLVGTTGTKIDTGAYTVQIAPTLSGSGKLIKAGSGTLEIGAATTTLADVSIQEGFVQAGDALTLNNLTVSNGAGFAYDISGMTEETAAAITATNYSGALTIKLLGASAGTYKLANVSGAMSGDDVSFVGLSDRVQATATVAADGLLSVTLVAGDAMDLTWDVAGPSNEWASSGDTNWDAAGSDAAFINGDSVTFAGEGETITVPGTVAPNNMTVSGTGYVFEGGSIAATGKLTVAASADAHIKSQASFAGGVEVNGTLTITDTTTAQDSQSALGTISGAGNVVLNLVENNGIGFDFSGMTGGNVNVNAGRLQLNQCLFNTAADATLPRIKLTNTADLVFNGNVDVRNNVEIEGDISPDVFVNSTASAAEMHGSITGGDNATLRVQDSGTWTLYGDVNVGTLSLHGATTNIASEVDVRDFSAAGGTIVLENGAVVTAETLRLSNERNSTSTMTINAGAKMTVSGTTYEDSNQDSLMIAHWNGNSVLKLNGGEFDASDAVMQLSWTGKGTFEAISGTADVKGITFNAQEGNVRGVLKLGTADGTDALKVNIGSHGITYVQGDNVTFELGNGTLAATADWAMTGNGTVNLVGTTGTKIDTGAYTVQIAPTLSGSGKLIKAGSGTLEIGAATTTLADVSIQEGFVHTSAAEVTVDSLSIAAGAGFSYDLSSGQSTIKADAFDGSTLGTGETVTLKLDSLVAGTWVLMDGADSLTKDMFTLDAATSSRTTAVLEDVVDGLVKVTVSIGTNNLDNLVWNAGHENDTWSSGGALNWTSAGTEEQFINGDSVTFSGVGETISISGTVAPKAITVTGTGYVLEGSGSIGDAEGDEQTTLNVATGAEITLGTANTYEGGTTIAEGATLTITHAQALGVGDAADSKVLGAVSGSGTLVVDAKAQTTIKGDQFAAFAGTVDVRSNVLTLSEYNPAEGGAFINKLIVRGDARVDTSNFANVEANTNSVDVDLMSGSTFRAFGGGLHIDGKIRFNVADPLSDDSSYQADGVVSLSSYWNQKINYRGLVEGAGTVEIKADWFTTDWILLNNENTFSGEYKLLVGHNNYSPATVLTLGAQNAAKDAIINLAANAGQAGSAKLQLNTDATIKGLKSGVEGNNIVTSTTTATLTVTEGDFGGSIQNGSDANVLSLTKQGAADTTLILRGANSYTGATTINGGTLELAAGAELASELITVAGGAVLAVNVGIYASTYVDGTGTIEKRAEAAMDYVDLAGLADTFAGTIDVQGGNLRLGDTLEIKTGRTLKAGANGVYLNNALTLSGGKLALDYTTAADAEITMLNLSENALTLLAGNTLSLSGLVLDTQQDNTVDLLTGVGSLLGSDGNALDLTGALASTYFSTIEGLGADIDTATLGLQLADGKLQLVVPVQTHYLVWDENKADDTWAAGTQFGDEAQDTFTSDADVKFGALTAESETVRISGAVAAGKVLIDGGEGKTYVFAPDDDASGIASAESITVNSGTACFWTGSLDMTADTTLAVNDGATLLLQNGSITHADAVDIVLNNGGTLSFDHAHPSTFASQVTVADGSTVNLVNNNTGVGMTLTNVVQGEGESATFNLSGANFSMDSEDLHGTINIGTRADGTTPINVNLLNSSTAFDQNFTGEGSVTVVNGATVRLSGTNTYSGQTINNANLIILGSQALSANTTMAGGSKMYLATAADGSNGEYTINRDFVSGGYNIGVYVGLNASDISGMDAVSGVKLTLGADAFLKASIFVRSGNELIVANGADINNGQKYNVESGASMTLQGAVEDTIEGAGTVKIDGDITWNNTGKTYTGETQVLAGSTLTAAAPLTSGTTKGKVQLLEDGAMIITNSTDWANKVYGAGTLVLVNGVNNLEAIVDGAATDTLATAYVGMPVQTYDTTDVDGVLTIDDAAAAAAAAKITDLVVQSGSRVELNLGASTNTLGTNLTLSGAGDATASANTETAAALTIKGGGAKIINSNIALAGDSTVYVNDANSAFQGGDYDSAGYTLTKTGGSRLTIETSSGKTADTRGDFIVQSGEMCLSGMGSANAKQAVGKVTLNGGAFFINNGHYSFADTDGALHVAAAEVGFHVAASAATAEMSSAVTGSGTIKMGTNGGTGTLTLSADNSFGGTWNVRDDKWSLQLAHANAAQNATLSYDASAALKLMDGTEAYNVNVLKSSVAGASIATEGTTRHTLNITNTLTAVADATYQGSVAGTVDVVLAGGAQKLSGALNDGSTYKVSAGTLALSGANQSGTHSFTATGGVLDMTGYTRADAATGADTIYALGGRVDGLNLGAGMSLADALADGSAQATGAVTLGGNTVLGAGTMNFRVTDSPNTIPGTETPYKLTDTLYQVGAETGDTISLAGGGAKTLLNLSITNALTEILDPTEENAGDGYRDHTLISGLTLADTSADASDFFATNLDGQDTGSTSYSLHFVQNAGNNALYDLVLRAMGAADTLFWNDADGGTWEAADQTPDSWVKGQMVDGTLTPGTTTADFEQLDYVVFDDLTDGAGAAVTDVTITVADAGVNIGNMTVQADTTNYTIGGGAISSTAGNTGATLTKTGTGTLTLTGANSYAGNTTISGGTVIAQNKAALSTTQAAVSGGAALVLDYAAATDADKALAASKVTLTGATLRALQDAKVNLGAVTSDSHLQAAAGSTLAVTPTANGSGYLYINQTPEGYTGAALTGTVAMDLTNYGTYVHNGVKVVVAGGEFKMTGGTNDTFKTNAVEVAEGATMQVVDGMTLSVNGFAGAGTIKLLDASKLEYRDNSGGTIAPKIVAEGATLKTGTNNTAAILTLQAGGLTLKGTETNAAADTTLSGGTWVLEQGAVVWDAAATGALAVAANTTVKVNDDTMKKLKVIGQNQNGGQIAKLATAKAGGSAAALSVETITVSNYGTVEGVNLTLTGTGSSIKSETNGTTGTADAVVVDVDGSITMDDTTPVALEIGGGVVLDSLTILRGEVKTVGTAWDRKIGGDAIVLDGSEAVLNLNGLDKTKNASGQAPTILIHAGSLKGADAFNGHVIIDDKGDAQTIAMGGLRAANADVLLRDIETATGVTTLTGFNGVKLADGSAFDLSSKLAEGEGNLIFSITNPDGDVKAATGATVTIGVNGVLGDVLDAGSVSYTIADKSIAPLASAVAWDATLALYNISATFGTDGKLTLSAVDVPLSEDDIYRSSEDNVGADGTQWAGNGPNVYSSSEPYASVYIDKDTVIDLTQAAAGDGEGLVLSNLIGRGNGANLTITGDGNDLVTINNNLEVTDVDSNLRSLSFNGDIDVTGTELQLLNTVATPGAQDAGELDTDSVYQINGALTADADSPVTITSGILKLNGKGSNASELLGGVLVANGKGLLQVSGEASVGGNLDISISDSDDEDAVPDAEIVSGGKLTLLDGAAVMSGFDIQGQGEGKETLSIAKDADVMLESYSSVTHTVLELQEGSELIWKGTQAPDAAIVDLDGLTGSGAIVNIEDQGGQQNAYIFINPQGDSTFNGDLRRYEGTIQVDTDGEGTQRFDKVTTAADSKVDMTLNGKSVINVAEETGNKTLALSSLMLNRGSDTTVEMNTDSGAPAFRINSGSVMEDGAALTLSSAAGEVLGAEDDLLFMEGASSNAQLSALDGKSITLDITDNAFRRLSETAKLVVEGDKVYVDLAASETNRYEEGASDPNAKAGAELLWNVDPSKLPADSALKAIDNAVAELMQNGNRDAAERALAATAGAGTAVLGSAFSADVERQLRAIRNRTTTMGVNQCEVNEGMPYVNAWINAEGDHREMDADGLAAGYTMDSWGGTVGFDVDITNNLTMGMAVTAMYGDLEADSADRAEGDFDTQYVSLFARVAHQAWTHTFVATLGRADVTLNRTVSVPGGSYETSGDTDGMAYGFMYEVARTFSLNEDGTTCWQPVFNVAWRHSSIDAYTESGADNALAVGEQDMNVLTFGAGARLQTVMGESLYNRASIFEARAMVKVDAGDREGEADVALLEGTTAASVKSAEIGAVGVEIGAGVTIPVGLNAGSIFIDGSAEFRSGYSNVNGTVGYRINF